MCGRFTETLPASALVKAFPGFDLPADLVPSHNIAPGQDVLVMFRNPEPQARLFRWGLVPSWSKEPAMGSRMINARAETLAEKPSYSRPFRKQRCLVPADGFYEWFQPGCAGKKVPVYFRMSDGRPFAFAGLWDRWVSAGGEQLFTFTIITTTPNELVAPLHDRMPVILDEDDYRLWLDPNRQDPASLSRALRPCPAENMIRYRVSDLVNNPSHNGPECVTPSSNQDCL